MDFVYKINTAKTVYTAANPKITVARLTRGRLVGGFIYFPSGPAGLLHFAAKIAVHQILPFGPGQNYALDDCVIPIHLSIDMPEPPFQIDLLTWNESNNHSHTLTVGLFLDPLSRRKWKLTEAIDALSPVKGYRKP